MVDGYKRKDYVMKQYPSIPGPYHKSKSPLGKPCIAFYKYDGSNLRWEWTKKRGWYKFGTRTRLFDQTDEDFGEAIPLFFNLYAEPIEKIIVDKYGKKHQKAIVFTEFFGKQSFAGLHRPNDPKELVLIDVNIHRKGIISPREFIKTFGRIHFSAEKVYEGNFNRSFINYVRGHDGYAQGTSRGLFEGVVVKGGEGHKLWMTKVKTNHYKELLKNKFENWMEFWE